MIKRPVYVKTMIMMLIVAAVVLAVFIPIYRKVLQTERNKIVEERRYYFQRSLEIMNSKVIVAQRISVLLNRSYSFLRLKGIENKDDLIYYSLLTNVATLTQNYFWLADSYQSTFVFISNSGTVIGPMLQSDDVLDFFSNKMVFEKMGPDEVVASLMLKNETMTFLPKQQIKIMEKSNNYLPFIYRDVGDSSPLCILFSSSDISKWFNLDLYADVDYYFYIKAITGSQKPVFTLNDSAFQDRTIDSLDYTVFNLKFADLNYECVLGIPNSYFNTYIRSSQILILATIIAAFFAAALVSFLLANRSYLPIRDLLSLSPTEGQKNANEYVLIRHFIEQLSKTNQFLNSHIDGLRNEMRSNTLIRLLFEFPQPESEHDIDYSLLPQLADDFRVAVISFDTDSEPVMLSLQSELAAKLGDSCCLARLRQRQLAALLPDSQEYLDLLEKSIIHTAQTINQTLAAGVSLNCLSVSDIQIALHQAQKALAKVRPMTIYCAEQDSIQALQNFDSHHLNKLKNLILSGDCDKADELILDISRIASEKSSTNHTAQSFYLVRSVIEEVCQATDNTDIVLPEYVIKIPIPELFGHLQITARSLSQKIQFKLRTRNQKLRQQIIDFINKNYTSTEMSSNMIADHFQISNQYVFRLVKEHTGRTLNKLVETMRMELAIDKISNTQLPMSEIAPLCGYFTLNNFYRAFHKHYGLPPGSFRKS